MTSHDASPADRTQWRARDALTAVLAGLLAAVVASVIVGRDPSPLAVFGLILPAQSVGMLAAIGLLARKRVDWRSALNVAWDPSDLWALLIGAGLQVGLSLIAYVIVVELLGGDVPSQEVVESAADAVGGPERAIVVLSAVLVVPLAEEFVFRGVLLGALRRSGSDTRAVLVSATAFAALHLVDPNAVFAVPFLFAAGVVTGRAVVRTGRLGRAVAIHAGFNLLPVLVLFSA